MATEKRRQANHIAADESPAPESGPVGSTFKTSGRGVLARLFREGYLFDFFQAVWLLEGLFSGDRAPGEHSRLREERILFRPHSGLAFPATDIKAVELLEGDPPRALVIATFMGLYGVDSPLPVYFYKEIATETPETFPLRDFLDIFNHRLYSLFYRAWKKYRPAFHFKSPGSDVYSQRALCLSGLGTGNTLDSGIVPDIKLAAFAGILSSRIRHAQGLQLLLAHFFEGIDVRIVEHVPRWVLIPHKPMIGQGNATPSVLGQTATIGDRIYDVSGKFRIVLGPLSLTQHLSFLPEKAFARRLHYLVRLYAPDHLDYDVELRLNVEEIPPLKLGSREETLGQATWLGRPKGDIVSRIVSYN